MTVATGEATDADPEQWLAKATAVTGSWWEPWAEWASARSGGRRPAPSSLGSAAHPAGDAGSGTATSWHLERACAGGGVGDVDVGAPGPGTASQPHPYPAAAREIRLRVR